MDWFFNVDAREWTSSGLSGRAAHFHRQLPGYRPTPLVALPAVAEELGVAWVLAKDESSRMGLPAFKVLGASWACARTVAQVTGADLDLAALRAAADGSGLRLVTATDGNHGRAVVWMARLLDLPATVFVPGVMSDEAERAIATEGSADVIRLPADYDEAVRIAAAYCDAGADAPEGETRLLVQDTAWPGYEVVPSWIVDGYATLLEEVDAAIDTPADLIVVPVGVGSLAQAVVTHYRHEASHRPAILSAEPETAACLLASLRAGRPTTVGTSATNMAGLNCGTVSSAAWPALSAGCDAAVAVSDDAAGKAVADLDALGLSSGPSGAATLAAVRATLLGPGSAGRRAELRIDDRSTVVLLSTEGADDA